jgi:hypothetical protein
MTEKVEYVADREEAEKGTLANYRIIFNTHEFYMVCSNCSHHFPIPIESNKYFASTPKINCPKCNSGNDHTGIRPTTNKIRYYTSFHQCRYYIPLVDEIFQILKKNHVSLRWFFFEPYAEITWVNNFGYSKNREIYDKILDNVKGLRSYDPHFICSSKIDMADWFHESPEEREFGYKAYTETSQIVMLMFKYYSSIDKGKGIYAQFKRRIHALANPMGLDYKREGFLCIAHGIQCLLYWYFPKYVRKASRFWAKRGWSKGI